MLTSNFVRNGDVLTAYHDEGQGDALLLLHGFTGSKLDFHDQLQWFTDRHRVLAPDNRGHGESSNLGHPDAYRSTFSSTISPDFSMRSTCSAATCSVTRWAAWSRCALRCGTPDRLKSLILMDTAAEPLTIFPKALREQLAEGRARERLREPHQDDARHADERRAGARPWISSAPTNTGAASN